MFFSFQETQLIFSAFCTALIFCFVFYQEKMKKETVFNTVIACAPCAFDLIFCFFLRQEKMKKEAVYYAAYRARTTDAR